MMPLMEAVPALEAHGDTPPLAAARMRRKLTVEAAARLARLTPDEVTWLEEGRLYRFPSSDSALLALLLYSTGLGIGRREARRLAGLPIFTRPGREQVRQAAGMLDRRRPPRSPRPERSSSRASLRQSEHEPSPRDRGSRPAADLEGVGGRPQRQRRHELHPQRREQDRGDRLPDRPGHPRRPLRLSRDRRSTSIPAARGSPPGWPGNSASALRPLPGRGRPQQARRRRRPGPACARARA